MAFFSNKVKPEAGIDFATSPASSHSGEKSLATSPAPDDHESDMPRACSFQPVSDQSTVSSTTTSSAAVRVSVDKLGSATLSQSMNTKATDLSNEGTSLAQPQVGGVKPTGLTLDIPSPEDKPARKTMSYEEVRAERKQMSVLRPGYNRKIPPRSTPGAPNSARLTVATDNTQAASSQ
jgi:hypothetical protein